MPNVYAGTTRPAAARYAIVVSKYNATVTRKLFEGAMATLQSGGVEDAAIDVAHVPGAWEIPLVARRLAESGQYAAVLALGAVIRGETTHDQHINRAVSTELASAAIATGVPVLFGVLTCDTLEQAIRRSGLGEGNKGAEVAAAALEMVDLLRKLPGKAP